MILDYVLAELFRIKEVRCKFICLFTSMFVLTMCIYLLFDVSSLFSFFIFPQTLDFFKIT